MPKNGIIKGMIIDNYCKNKYALCFAIFIFGVMVLLYYISLVKNHTKIIENYSKEEIKQISDKVDQLQSSSGNSNMDLSGIFKIDLSGIIKRLFAPRCLAGCMSPNSSNRNDEMCKKNVTDYGMVVLECPWRCNIDEFKNQMDENLMFKSDILKQKLKMLVK